MRGISRGLAFRETWLFWALSFFVALTANLEAARNKLLDLEFKKAANRTVVRDKDGYFYLLTPAPRSEGGQAIALRVSRKPLPKSISDFSSPTMLPSLPEMGKTSFFSAGIAIDLQDRLHLIWTNEQGLTAYSVADTKQFKDGLSGPKWLHPVSGKEGGVVIGAARSLAGDIRRAPNGGVWLAWTSAGKAGAEVAVHLGNVHNGEWRSSEVGRGEGFYPPSLSFSKDGRFFLLACSDAAGFTHHLKGKVSELNTRTWSFKRTAHGNRPALAETNSRLIAVHETGISQLEYVFPEEESPQAHPFTALDARLELDTVYSPQFALDGYGVPWLFFIDGTRQHVFYSRWLGNKWSPILNGFWLTRNSPRFEENHLSVDYLGVEDTASGGKSSMSIGVMTGHSSAFPTARFDVLSVPSLSAEPQRKILFLDLKEIQELDGLELRLDTASKFSGNPVIAAGGPGDFDAQGTDKLRVIKENGVYRMWYAGVFRERGSHWPESGPPPQNRPGYAESLDGRSFVKKPLGLSSFGGNPDTNLVVGLPSRAIFQPLFFSGIHLDPSDPDPKRRYKLLNWDSVPPPRAGAGPDLAPADEEQGWTLFASEDGIRWREAHRGSIRFPGGKPGSFTPISLFHDPEEQDPDKKYKAYGFSALNHNRRGGSYAYSRDALEWTADSRNPVFDPYARTIPVVRSGKVEQIHDVVVWKYHQYYLTLYQYQRSGESMDVELAMSRDGENFAFIQPGEQVVRRGAPGEWDSDMVAPSVPLVDENEIKLYYGGYSFKNSPWIEGQRAGGLATLRLDGFTHLQLEQARDRGSFTTIPVTRGSARDLYINASCKGDSRLEVELIDPQSESPLPGFSRQEGTSFQADSLAHKIVWEGRSLRDVKVSSFQIRFHFTRGQVSPNLYSFEFR